MKKCPNCGQLNSDLATTCHSCHCNLNGTPSSNNASNHNTAAPLYNNQTGNPHSQYGNPNGNPYQSGTQPYNMPPNGYTGGKNGSQNGGSTGRSTSKTPANSVATFLAIGFAITAIFLGIAFLNTKSELKIYEGYKTNAMYLENNVAFTSDSKTYHTLNCQYWDKSRSFFAASPEIFQLIGLEPCQYCIGN